MDNNQFNQFNQGNPMNNGQMSTKKLFEYIGLGCSALGCLLTVIFSIVTCSRSAKPSVSLTSGLKVKMSLWIIGVIIAVVIAIAGLVLTILSMEKGQKISKLALVSFALAAVAILWAILPNFTVCAYNCAVNKKIS